MTQLRPAVARDRELLRNMFNLMHAELAPFMRELTDIDENGYFDASAADAYLAGDERARAYFIMENERTAGVIAMTSAPYAKPGCDYCLQEIYVLPHMRGQGAASAACRALLSAYLGRWCCIALTNNVRGLKFCEDVLVAQGSLIASARLDDESAFFEFNVDPTLSDNL